MRKLVLIICALILAVGITGSAIASDVTSAKYLVTVEVVNASASEQINQPAVFTLSTNATIAADMLNATATDVAMLTSLTGTDVPFMPGLNTNPWVFLTDNISAASTEYRYTYMKEVTGGKIVWFPGAAGMTVPDGMTEPGNNFSITLTDCFIDTTAGSAKFIVNHSGGVLLNISTSISGTIEAHTYDGYYPDGLNTGYSVNATAIATGEHDITISLAANILTLTVDGVAFTQGGVATIDNSVDDWDFCKGNTVSYVESIAYSQGGAPVSAWAWELDTTFHDSVGANDGTPSFRTTGAADLTATATTVEGLYEPSVPIENADGGGWSMITNTVTTPGGLFTDGGSGFPIGAQIAAAATAAGDDPVYWIYFFAFGLAVAAFVIVYAKTHSSKLGRKGSLILAALCGEMVLVYFYITDSIPGLALVPAGILLITLVFWRKSAAPVD